MTVLAVGLAGLAEVIGVSLLAGVGVTAVFSLAILGAVRSGEARRGRRSSAQLVWSALSLLAMAAVAAAVAAGLRVVAG